MTTNQITPSTPRRTLAGYPIWYHPGGNKVMIRGYNSVTTPNRELVIGSIKHLNMTIAKNHHPQDKEGGEWLIKYKMDHGLIRTWTEGFIIMTTQDLMTAFGLSGECEAEDGQGLIDLYGGDAAKNGKYIRFEEFLCIPGPGHGQDGDANVSIRVGKDLKSRLKEFMEMFDED